MKIKRMIDGKTYEFELTDDELEAAYNEQQWRYDVDDIHQRLLDMIEDHDLDGYLQRMPQERMEELIPRFAEAMRTRLCNDHIWWHLSAAAIYDVLDEYLEEVK